MLLIFTFSHFNDRICLCVFIFGLFLCRVGHHAFWTWMSVAFPRLGSFQLLCLCIYVLSFVLSFLCFWDPCNVHISVLDVVPEVSKDVLIFSFYFLFNIKSISDFLMLSSSLLICSSVSLIYS